jgi:membrane-associated protease RseP (regulator of RpoE activity)
MRAFRSLPRPLLAALATLFAAATILYSALWTTYGNRAVPVELGFDNKYLPVEHCQLVQSVVRDSPAERAGMKRGDCIVGINGAPLQGEDSLTRIWSQHKPGDAIELTVRRAEAPSPVILHATFRASSAATAEAGVAQHVGQGILRLFPFAFLVVGLAVLFLRLEDRNVWRFHRYPGLRQFVPGPAFAFATFRGDIPGNL